MNAAGIRVRQTLSEMFFEARRQRADRITDKVPSKGGRQPLMMEGDM